MIAVGNCWGGGGVGKRRPRQRPWGMWVTCIEVVGLRVALIMINVMGHLSHDSGGRDATSTTVKEVGGVLTVSTIASPAMKVASATSYLFLEENTSLVRGINWIRVREITRRVSAIPHTIHHPSRSALNTTTPQFGVRCCQTQLSINCQYVIHPDTAGKSL